MRIARVRSGASPRRARRRWRSARGPRRAGVKLQQIEAGEDVELAMLLHQEPRLALAQELERSAEPAAGRKAPFAMALCTRAPGWPAARSSMSRCSEAWRGRSRASLSVSCRKNRVALRGRSRLLPRSARPGRPPSSVPGGSAGSPPTPRPARARCPAARGHSHPPRWRTPGHHCPPPRRCWSGSGSPRLHPGQRRCCRY